MKLLHLALILAMGGASLAAFVTSDTLHAATGPAPQKIIKVQVAQKVGCLPG